MAMPAVGEHKSEQGTAQARAHIASPHQILKALQEGSGKHPEIGAAITKLEMALNDLAAKTGGLVAESKPLSAN